MPTDEANRIIEDNLFRIDQMVQGLERGMGLPIQGLSPEQLRQAYQWASEQVQQARQLAQAGRLTPRSRPKFQHPSPRMDQPGAFGAVRHPLLRSETTNPRLLTMLRQKVYGPI